MSIAPRRLLLAALLIGAPPQERAAALEPAPSANGDDDVVTVAAPPVAGVNAAYRGRRPPLAPEPLVKLPVGTVRPRGWLEQQLKKMATGMFGRLPEVSHWCRPDGSAWRSKDGSGANGWEELPYWLKGFTVLAHLSSERDAGALAAMANQWNEALLASQRLDGYFGPDSNRATPDLWPNMPALWALRSHYEATGDARVVDLLKRYFRFELEMPRERLLPDSWQKVRGGDNLDVVHWLYDETGEPWLLELAQALHERTADWSGGIASWHGVNFCQGFREPLQFFVQSGDPKLRAATLADYETMMKRYGQVPGGMFGADENCRPGCDDPRQGAEACSMVEFMLSFEMLASITGETVWGDRCEEVAFNSLPAAVDPEMRALHYLTAPNLVACDEQNHAPAFENDGCMLAFSPDERYRCCQHNVVMGWPFFTERAWFATRDGGLAALLWAPCEVNTKEARVRVDTEYPLSDRIEITVECAAPRRFPLYVRVPGWCASAEIPGLKGPPPAGAWVKVERTWQGTSTLALRFPMELRVRRFAANHGAAAVDRGPLTYSLALVPEWKSVGAGEWATRTVSTADPWNLALALDRERPESSFQLIQSQRDLRIVRDELPAHRRPAFEPRLLGMAVKQALAVKARRVPGWQLDHGLAGRLHDSPVRVGGEDETVLLVPMGACYVRICAFPVLGDGPDAKEWNKPSLVPSASHEHDRLEALFDRVLPARSGDQAVARFTWWDHRGTVEWVQYDFDRPRTIGSSSVYWYDDGAAGHCRVPESWRLLWLDPATNEWREVAGTSACEVAKDRANLVTFPAVVTSAIRLEATLQPQESGGILEWSVAERAE
jgi:hypothetical protein